jgi:tagatose 1,6-diphosphate aldolase
MPQISSKKMKGINAVADDRGVIRAAAMDQRGSLKKALAKGKGCDPSDITWEMMSEFKTAVTKVLTPHASAILLDPEFGIEASKARSKNAGLLLAYELSGYDNNFPGRVPTLVPTWCVRKSVEAGADCIKILMYYTHEEDPHINDIKKAWVERIGCECAMHEIPFFLECVAYDPKGEGKDVGFAKRKPAAVADYMKEFSKPQYYVDVLKVEVPITQAFVEGAKANKTGEVAYSKSEAKDHFVRAAEVARLPFIYLSAGVDDDVYRESLELAGEAGVNFAGVLCGRATWKEGIPVYAKSGVRALEDWLGDRGVKNIKALNDVLDRVAHPWFDKYGGKGKIQTVDRTPTCK